MFTTRKKYNVHILIPLEISLSRYLLHSCFCLYTPAVFFWIFKEVGKRHRKIRIYFIGSFFKTIPSNLLSPTVWMLSFRSLLLGLVSFCACMHRGEWAWMSDINSQLLPCWSSAEKSDIEKVGPTTVSARILPMPSDLRS